VQTVKDYQTAFRLNGKVALVTGAARWCTGTELVLDGGYTAA
jgi:hypothetical protein